MCITNNKGYRIYCKQVLNWCQQLCASVLKQYCHGVMANTCIVYDLYACFFTSSQRKFYVMANFFKLVDMFSSHLYRIECFSKKTRASENKHSNSILFKKNKV